VIYVKAHYIKIGTKQKVNEWIFIDPNFRLGYRS